MLATGFVFRSMTVQPAVAPPSAPQLSAPAIAGAMVSPAAGEVGTVFTASDSGVTGNPLPTLGYVWKLDGATIGGATASTYASITAGDLTVRITATNSEGSAFADSGAAEVTEEPSAGGIGAMAIGSTFQVLDTDAWWHPSAVLALDYENARFYVAGIEYASIAAMVAAGFYTDATYDSINLSGIFTAGNDFVLWARATSDNTSAAINNKAVVSVDNDTDTTSSQLLRPNNTTQRSRTEIAGVTQASIDVTVADNRSRESSWAHSVNTNNFNAAENGTSGTQDTAGAIPAITHMRIGNNRQATRAWTGTIEMIQLLDTSLAASDLATLTGTSDVDVVIQVLGDDRTFQVHVPASAPSPAKVLITFHGANSSIGTSKAGSRFNDYSDTHGFIAVWPSAIDGVWNDSDQPGADGDDVAFTDAMVAYLSANFDIAEAEIYVCGVSNGGMFVLRLANERPTIFAGYGVVATSMSVDMGDVFAPAAAPVPCIIMHGTADGVVPFTGGTASGGSAREFMSSDATRDKVAASAGSNLASLVTTALPDVFPLDGTTVEEKHYADTPTVQQYVVTGGGHTWPGSPIGGSGTISQDIDASEILLEAFGLN